eukprot:TRINITY_DN1293_c0_g1_i1.p1 TRINITY_DN1293_c0_g1~~TRINITY_DN1293_c0_g1_i1.p1  ORF type:complete len:131 (-),score=34.48 TRINITY_DN1293_c0_g1_i1:260-652(-)
MACVTSFKSSAVLPKRSPMTLARRSGRSTGTVTRAELITNSMLVISGCNAAMLALGRFVAMPYQRKSVENAGLPVQNGTTHYAAGDRLAEEASFFLKTGDPSGFNIIDVLAWGSLGHAIGFAALAAASLQ